MSVEVPARSRAGRRASVYVDGYTHSTPIPAACRIDNIIYSSIINGIDPSRPDATATLAAQAELMFARLSQIAEAAGASLADVIKVNIWMPDRGARDEINALWVGMFPDAADRPARQTVNAQMESPRLIQCDFVAVIDTQREKGDTPS